MSDSARIAFVGAGSHSTECLYPCIAHIPEFDLVATCDLDEARAQSAAKRFGAAEACADLTKMLDTVVPDAVCICGMPDMHHDVGLECLKRGLPVWMEKPPAWDLAGSVELVDAASDAGTWGMVGFMKRFAQANAVAKSVIDSGDIGPVSSITLIHGAGKYDEHRRMLLFNGIHMIDLGRFLGGEWKDVFAFGTETAAGTQAISASFTLVDGGVGQLNINSAQTWNDCTEEAYVSCAEGAIKIDSGATCEVIAQNRQFAEPEDMRVFGWSDRYFTSHNLSGWHSSGHHTKGYWGELSHFARAVLGQVEPIATLADGVENMRIIEAILRSVETGESVALADVE